MRRGELDARRGNRSALRVDDASFEAPPRITISTCASPTRRIVTRSLSYRRTPGAARARTRRRGDARGVPCPMSPKARRASARTRRSAPTNETGPRGMGGTGPGTTPSSPAGTSRRTRAPQRTARHGDRSAADRRRWDPGKIAADELDRRRSDRVAARIDRARRRPCLREDDAHLAGERPTRSPRSSGVAVRARGDRRGTGAIGPSVARPRCRSPLRAETATGRLRGRYAPRDVVVIRVAVRHVHRHAARQEVQREPDPRPPRA